LNRPKSGYKWHTQAIFPSPDAKARAYDFLSQLGRGRRPISVFQRLRIFSFFASDQTS
jgi:hypothetical protein